MKLLGADDMSVNTAKLAFQEGQGGRQYANKWLQSAMLDHPSEVSNGPHPSQLPSGKGSHSTSLLPASSTWISRVFQALLFTC